MSNRAKRLWDVLLRLRPVWRGTKVYVTTYGNYIDCKVIAVTRTVGRAKASVDVEIMWEYRKGNGSGPAYWRGLREDARGGVYMIEEFEVGA